MLKFTIILRRNPALTHEQFVEHHRNVHGPLFCSLPEVKQFVRRYVQCHETGDQLPGLPPSNIDGSTELWFDDLAGLAGVFTSQSYMETIRPDEASFLDLHACEFLLATENVVIA